MKDIDFDELDRAVSSVLGKKDAKNAAGDKSASETTDTPAPDTATDIGSDTATDDTTRQSTPSSESSTPEVTSSTAVDVKPTPLAVKRRGKFMDVMHPSADMQPNAPAAAKPALSATRTAPTITPLLTEETDSSSDSSPEPVADLDEGAAMIGAAPALVETEVEPVAASDDSPVETTEEEPAGSTDVAVTDSADDSTPQDAASDVDSIASESDESGANPENEPVATTPTATEPQVTPFLTDTQVEKRPLGAFGEPEAPAEAAQEAEAEAGMTVEPLTPAAAPAALPRELQPDVVTVESVQEAEAEQAAASAQGSAQTPASPFAAKVGVAPDADDGRVEGHPLFDTSTYHEPIAAVHPHGMPGWAKWALGLLACLAVGAGVGYFLFAAGL